MPIRRTAALIVALVVAAGVLASSPVALAASSKTDFTVFLKGTSREVLDLGGSGPTVGDVVTGSGDVSRKRGGPVVGTWSYRSETVRVNIPGGVETRNSTVWVKLPGGTIGTTGLISLPQGTRPVAVQKYIVLGGTDKYAGVRGTMTVTPLDPDTYRADFHLLG